MTLTNFKLFNVNVHWHVSIFIGMYLSLGYMPMNIDIERLDDRDGPETLLWLVRPWPYHHSEFFLFVLIITMTYKLVRGIA